ncbi:unnamed protein product [Toxocara canis]|uniref:G_PROTEIN_RECEP_F1_2 domain-containing protein n=1 Tax=Toxocara canis TaxID=6265 RepID=A0A183V5F8_TOXCA|nr:unnamed protein product [Toxocara canis]
MLMSFSRQSLLILSDFRVIEDSETLNFIDGNAFGKLRNLGKLSVSGCKNLKEITGTLLINNTKILSLCVNTGFETILHDCSIIEENGLVRMPTLRMTDQHRFAMELIDFSHNEIEYLGDGQIRSVHANELRLSHNKFREIGGHVFADCKFSYIYLDNNMELKRMSMNTFGGISLIQNLDLSRTAISELPTKGLSKLERLKLEDTDNLKKLPTILAFTSLKKAEFTYPYHCCLFRHASKEIDLAGKEFTENLEEIRSRECSAKAEALSRIKMALRRRKRSVDANDSKEGPLDLSDLFMWFDSVNNGDVLIEVGDDSPELDPEFDDEQIGQLTNFNCTSSAVSDFFASIECSPMPDALNPCENVVGYQFLRWAIWFVWISAIIGNIGVWVVLATVRQKRMRVHYFFMANLAAADLLTGASMVFFRNAFYGRRLRERTAYILMGCAYIFALTMALLPLVGVSTYTSTSVCLPLSIENVFDRFYLMFGLLFNLLAFLGMSVCYVLIVKMLRNPDQPSRPEDKQIIAKMAVLIGTDMLCWFPTLFFGFTATLNMPLISISVAKIFLVLFYPINAFANPFLYVFFTKVIQKNVRPRAMSFLKRISLTNLTNDRTITSLSNFYNTQPTYRFKLDEIRHLLQTTQVTSVASTPRGSNASSYQKTITSCNETSWKSSPRVSFQEEAVNHLAIPPKRKSISGQKQRVSAVPEMSDISEHSISDEHHDKLIKASSNSAKPVGKPVVPRKFSVIRVHEP